MGIVAAAFVIGLYFLPSIFAYAQNHHNRVAILTLNFFLGWTCIGWIAAAIWCSTKPPPQQIPPPYQPYYPHPLPPQYQQQQQYPQQQIGPWNQGR
jgi:hypothetical protein